MTQSNRGRPHLKILNPPEPTRFQNTRGGGGGSVPPHKVNRQSHANRLLQELEAIQQQRLERPKKQGMYLTFELTRDDGVHEVLKSLENRQGKEAIELLHVQPVEHTQGETMKATIYVPASRLDYFNKKIKEFRDQDSKKSGHPKNAPLISRVQRITMADVQDLYTGDLGRFPDWETPIWWEAWLRQGTLEAFREEAQRTEIQLQDRYLTFLDREVVHIHASALQLLTLLQDSTVNALAELRLAKHAAAQVQELGFSDKRQFMEDLLENRLQPNQQNTLVTLLDTGVMHTHPLLRVAIDAASSHSLVGMNPPVDWHGHGTKMAGILTYGMLAETLLTAGPVPLNHRLESVQILHPTEEHDPGLYAAITRDAVHTVESIEPFKKRVYCMAVSVLDGDLAGLPSAWSAEIDQLAFGDGETTRLFLLSAGNVPVHDAPMRYQQLCDVYGVEDPGQSWNALTVGAYTDLTTITDPTFTDFLPVSPTGGLAPMSRTSTGWTGLKNSPMKPEIVMEGGNHIYHPDPTNHQHQASDELSLITTSKHPVDPLIAFGDTSAATALAGHLAAQVAEKYPHYRAETLRALMVHAAEWTPAMKTHSMGTTGGPKSQYQALLRRVGYGVPQAGRLLSSQHNDFNMVVESALQPFAKNDRGDIRINHVNYHTIQLPTKILQDLGEAAAELRVTLSYFIEPNPGEKGRFSRSAYMSHKLGFHVRAAESLDNFKKRINKAAREETTETESFTNEEDWLLGANARKGSVMSDIWQGTAAELARRDCIAVYPVGGWWKARKQDNRWDKKVQYTLVVGIKVKTEIDLYQEVQVLNSIATGITTENVALVDIESGS